MEITDVKSSIIGRAIFGTENGLQAQGDGVLANAGKNVSIFEFEEARQRDGRIQQIPHGHFALFFRRVSSPTGQNLNLLGAVSPCVDAHGRRGFMGACLAIKPDRTKPHWHMSDWASFDEALHEIYELIASQVNPSSRQLRWGQVFQKTQNDFAGDWQASGGQVIRLHRTNEPDDTLFEVLQSIAFVHGSKHSTALVFDQDMGGTTPLNHQDVLDVLTSFRAKRQSNPGRKTGSRGPTNVRQVIEAAQSFDTEARVDSLFEEVVRLREEVDQLKRTSTMRSTSTGLGGQTSFAAVNEQSPFFENWILIVGGLFGVGLAIGVLTGLVLYFT